jgi:hypothetical protein
MFRAYTVYGGTCRLMDIVQLVAQHKIETAIEEGLFDHLAACGEIDCSLRGESFLVWWLRLHYGTASTDET